MGYAPPPPPSVRPIMYGTTPCHAGDLIIVGRPLHRTDYFDSESAEHRARMAREHAETMRQARVGTLLLVAFVVTIVVCVAQLVGLL